ncbi:hypothetical protein [Streptomyces sp. MST-110588]|uniref:hypothetical protein n=1 Tax=Streptomyces sp. MST-110588 TaxID=2833628 RepID=UPI001F5C7B49|nr:hypothetical protein [Streptomyces sp. MST-110588]UNO38369.1 hypothetical protein KGS77_00265 [Streptomyces sp. MST-110588]
MISVDSMVDCVKSHRLYAHPMYDHWAETTPPVETTAALFHQVQKFCASTRPGLAFPPALREMGWNQQADLIQEIVESESGHGAELATMAGHIVNRIAGEPYFSDVFDRNTVEPGLKEHSDRILGALPGYDPVKGLTAQAAAAISVFERRTESERTTTIRNLGTSLALEIISNQSIIPGEKRALVDSGHYGVTMEEPEMHYLAEHWGECGAEQLHERNVIEAVGSVIDRQTAPELEKGMTDFLESLSALWDVIDAALLKSGVDRVHG